MKLSTIFLALLTLILVSKLSAQKFNYGVKAGMSVSNFVLDYSRTASSFNGLTCGAFGSYSIGDYLAVEVQLNYLQRGATMWQKNDTTQSTAFIHALEMPILAHFYPIRNSAKDMLPYIFAGHSATLNISATSDDSRESMYYKDFIFKSEKDITSMVNYFDFGIITGIGFTFNGSGYIYTIDAGYRLGYTNAVLHRAKNYSINSFFITVGVGF
jgi:hypothetical protein